MRKWVLANRQRIQQAIHADLSKPAEEADLTEIYVVLSDLKKAIRNLKYWNMPEPEGQSLPYLGTRAQVYYEPKGTVLIISPWNYPFSLAVGPLVSALAAGNTVIIKPSELSENTSELIKEMVNELFEEDVAAVFTGGVEVSTELLKLPFDHIFFTGSPRVGKIVMEAAAKNLSSVTLELGGKSPCIIDKSANIKDAATKVAWGKWLNAGQTCLAPDLVFVHEQIRDAFLSELKNQAHKLYGQDYSSIISAGHFKRLAEWKEKASQKAEVFLDGKMDEKTRKMEPTIIVNPDQSSDLAQNEIFGPICHIQTFSTLDEVIDEINARPKALSAYVFAKNHKVINTLKHQTSSGSFVINENVLQFAHPTLPFGGVNNSGIGKSHGKYGFIAFSNQKAVLKQRVGFTMAKILYPPYNNFKRLNIDFLLKYF